VARDEVAPVEASDPARLYVCGVTPYDTTHMGHAATYVTFDLVNRALRDGGRAVSYVQNVTDVDDPLFERAARDGVDWRDLGQDQIALFLEDMTALGVIPPEHFMGVMESMPVIIEAVQALVDRGVTYEVVEAGVRDTYLDLTAAGGLGELSHLSRETMLEFSAERGGDPQRPGKRDPLDPMLWRGERDGEPAWDAGALGRGRPGWHIECSAMSAAHLGPTIDIHAGGVDLTFPHHENEVAQSTCAHGGQLFARWWLHNGMLTFGGRKMSKSLGNVLELHALLDQHPPEALRLLLLKAHYRQPLDWTDEALTQSVRTLDGWYGVLRDLAEVQTDEAVQPIPESIEAALCDDLNTPIALAGLAALADHARKADTPQTRKDAKAALLGGGAALGLLQQEPEDWFRHGAQDIDAERVDALIAERRSARETKDWARADAIRDQLDAMGVSIEDGADGTRWSVARR
jgi:cysteine--1-D-myo-inosityl 2-amino-2-deoxy-alpha-D-glucopyranoside ligase